MIINLLQTYQDKFDTDTITGILDKPGEFNKLKLKSILKNIDSQNIVNSQYDITTLLGEQKDVLGAQIAKYQREHKETHPEINTVTLQAQYYILSCLSKGNDIPNKAEVVQYIQQQKLGALPNKYYLSHDFKKVIKDNKDTFGLTNKSVAEQLIILLMGELVRYREHIDIVNQEQQLKDIIHIKMPDKVDNESKEKIIDIMNTYFDTTKAISDGQTIGQGCSIAKFGDLYTSNRGKIKDFKIKKVFDYRKDGQLGSVEDGISRFIGELQDAIDDDD